MKKFVRGQMARSLSMLLIMLFMLPSMLLPLASRGDAAIGGRINILFLPLTMADADAPGDLGTRILQELQIAIARREGVQVTELKKNSPILKRAMDLVDETEKLKLSETYQEAADPAKDMQVRTEAASYLVKALGVDAIVFGAIDKYEFTKSPDKHQSFIHVTANKVTMDDKGVTASTPLITIGKSWIRPDGKGDQISHDQDAIQAIAQNMALQLTGRPESEPKSDKRGWWPFGKSKTTRHPDSVVVDTQPGQTTSSTAKPRSTWLWLLLGAAAVAAIAGGGGGGSDSDTPVAPPPVNAMEGYAYPNATGEVSLQIAKPSDWDNIDSFWIYRDQYQGELNSPLQRGARSRISTTPVQVYMRDGNGISVVGNTVYMKDTPPSGYLFQYRIDVVLKNNTRRTLPVYYGDVLPEKYPYVGGKVPAPIARITAAATQITDGRATIYWYMPGESITVPPMVKYVLPTAYVANFTVFELRPDGTWLPIYTTTNLNARSAIIPVSTANTDIAYTVCAVSKQGLLYPISLTDQSKTTININSLAAYQPTPPTNVKVTAVTDVTGAHNYLQISWNASVDPLVTSYKVYRMIETGTPNAPQASMSRASSSSLSRSRNRFATIRSRAVPINALLLTEQPVVAGRTIYTVPDTSINYQDSYVYYVTAIAAGGAESVEAPVGGARLSVTPATAAAGFSAPPALITDTTNTRSKAIQLTWAIPNDLTVCGYIIKRQDTTSGFTRGTAGITGSHSKLPGSSGTRSTRNRGLTSLRGSGSSRGPVEIAYEVPARNITTWTDRNLIDDVHLIEGQTYNYTITYKYLTNKVSGDSTGAASLTYDTFPGDPDGAVPGYQDKLGLVYADGSATISWLAPTQTADGFAPMTDGYQFKVYRSTRLATTTGRITRSELMTYFDPAPISNPPVPWGTTDPRTFNDPNVPENVNVTYAVVAVDAGPGPSTMLESPGPYPIAQVIVLPDPETITATPTQLSGTANDTTAQAVTVKVTGNAGGTPVNLLGIDVTAQVSPTNAGTVSDATAGTYGSIATKKTDANGEAIFYWKPPALVNMASIGKITFSVSPTVTAEVSLSIQEPMPANYKFARNVALAIMPSQGTAVNPTRIYYSNDPDDMIGLGTPTASKIQVTATTDTGAAASFAKIRLTTVLGGFASDHTNHVISADKKTIEMPLDNNGQTDFMFTGEPKNGIAGDPVGLPRSIEELGSPMAGVIGKDVYDIAVDATITGTLPPLIGPPAKINVGIDPTLPPGFPNQGNSVTFSTYPSTVRATAVDIRGEAVISGMPIGFLESWREFETRLPEQPYDYEGCMGPLGFSGDRFGPIALTNDSGVAQAGFQSNYSGSYTIRAFALTKGFQDAKTYLEGVNNTTGGLDFANLTNQSQIMQYLLWHTGDGPATKLTWITDSAGVLNKTLADTKGWTVNWVKEGATEDTEFSTEITEKPDIVIDAGGTYFATINFTANDKWGKKVLPGVPFKVNSVRDVWMGISVSSQIPGGLLQLSGQQTNINGQVLQFGNNSDATVVSRGDNANPAIGMIKLQFDNMQAQDNLYITPGYLLAHGGKEVNGGDYEESYPDRMYVTMTMDGKEIKGVARMVDADTEGLDNLKSLLLDFKLVDINGNPAPDNSVVEIESVDRIQYVMLQDGIGTFTYTSPRLSMWNTQPDVIDTGYWSFAPLADPPSEDRVLAIRFYINPFDPPYEKAARQYITVERPHRMTLTGLTSNSILPLNAKVPFGVAVKRNAPDNPNTPFDESDPLNLPAVLPGFLIKFAIVKDPTTGRDSSLAKDVGPTDEGGNVANELNTGTQPDLVDVVAYYDLNVNNQYDAGTDLPAEYIEDIRLGLEAPVLTGAIVDGVPSLSWTLATGANRSELQRSGDGNVWLTPSIFLNVPTNTYDDNNPVPPGATGLFYQVRTNTGVVNSAFSNVVQLPIPLAMVAGFTRDADQSIIKFNWQAVNGATSYIIRRSTDGTTWPDNLKVDVGNVLTWTDAAPPAGTTVWYSIQAVDAATKNSSKWSSSIQVGVPLPMPAGFARDDTQLTSLKLNWTKVTGATDYEIRRSANTDPLPTTGTSVGDVATWTDASPIAGATKMNYQVRAKTTTLISPWSATITIDVPPAVPSGFTRDATDLAILKLNWTKSAGALDYEVAFSTDNVNWPITQATKVGDVATWTDAAPLAGATQLYYRLRAVNGTSYSAWTTVIGPYPVPLATPAPPVRDDTDLSVIRLMWTKVGGAAGYDVAYTTNPAAWPAGQVNNLGDVDNWTDTTPLAGATQLYYRLRSTNGGNISPWTTYIGPVDVPLAVPTNFVRDTTDITTIKMTWTGVGGATTYEVRWNTDGSTTFPVANIRDVGNVTSWNDVTPPNAAKVYYQLRAKASATIFSPWTASVEVDVPPAAPTDFVRDTTLASDLSIIKMKWGMSTLAQSYEIQRSQNSVTYEAPVNIGNVATWTDGAPIAGANQMFYQIRSINGTSKSAWVTVPALLIPVPLAAPASISRDTGDLTVVRLNWTAVTGATGYQVQKSLDGTNFTESYDVTANTWDDPNITLPANGSGTQWSYRVRAYNGASTSPTWTGITITF